MAGIRDLVGIYEIGDPNEMDIRSEEWVAFLVHTMQAIALSAPHPPPEGMVYETGAEWQGNTVYVLLTVRTEHALSQEPTPALRAVQKAFHEDRPLSCGVIDTSFRMPAKGTPESRVRAAYFRVTMKQVNDYETKLRHVDMALKGDWPGGKGEG